ncbi:MAG: Mov34/MPN/PAD-1 family protein [Promethearchaeota archaeon]
MSLKEESKKKKVIIKWRAYVKMLKHVLRFGSNAKDKSQYKEVMGVLIGHLVDQPGIIKDVIIEDAVPISHGGHVEVAFKPEDYGSFSVVDSRYADKGWFSVGWYHSHPGLTCFFSAVDVRNQMGWQGPNPSAVGIVWDHTRLGGEDGDMGFDVYRLDEPQNPMSDYHEVPWIVEPPETEEFYLEGIVDLINSLQKGEPPILELNEVPDVFGDFEVPGINSMKSKEPELVYTEIADSLKGGIEKMADIFIQPLIQSLNEWARGMTQGIINKNVLMLQNLKGLKENLSKSMADLQSWFKYMMSEGLRDLWVFIDDKFDLDEEQLKKMQKSLDDLKLKMEQTFKEATDKALAGVIEDIAKKVGDAVDKLNNVNSNIESIAGTITSQKTTMESTLNTYIKKVEEIKKSGEETLSESIAKFKKELDPVDKDVEALQKDLSDIKISLKAILSMLK